MHHVLHRDDATVHFDTTGSGQPVLFIHAGVADSRMWDAQFQDVEGARLVRFDMRGYGRSRLGSRRFQNRDDAFAVLDHFDIERAVLVGCSVGGNTALQMAAAAPERVDGLVLVAADAPGFDPAIDYESPEWPEAVKAFGAGDLARVAELEAEMWLAGIGRTCADLPRETVDRFIDMDLIALRNENHRVELDSAEPLKDIPALDAPVEVIVGARDIPQLIAAAEHLASTTGGDRRPVILQNTAHLPSMDQPGAFNDALQRFLVSI